MGQFSLMECCVEGREVPGQCFTAGVSQAPPGARAFADVILLDCYVSDVFQYANLFAQHGISDFDSVPDPTQFGLVHLRKGGRDGKPYWQAQILVQLQPGMNRHLLEAHLPRRRGAAASNGGPLPPHTVLRATNRGSR